MARKASGKFKSQPQTIKRSLYPANNESQQVPAMIEHPNILSMRPKGPMRPALEKEGFAFDKSSTIISVGTSQDLTHNASSIRNRGHPSVSDSANSIGDMKRERKIARHAKRRAQNEQRTLGSVINDLKEGQVLSKMCSMAPTGQSDIDLCSKSREKGGYGGCEWECLRANCYAVQQRVADNMWQFYIVTPKLFFLHTKPYSAVPKSCTTFLLRVEQIPLLIILNKHVLRHLLIVFALEFPKRRVPHTQQSSSCVSY